MLLRMTLNADVKMEKYTEYEVSGADKFMWRLSWFMHTHKPAHTQLHKARHSLLLKNYKVRWEGMSSDFPLFTSLAESQRSQEDPLRQRFTKAKNITHCTLECEATGFDSVWGVKYLCQHVRENAWWFCEDQSSVCRICTYLFKRQM